MSEGESEGAGERRRVEERRGGGDERERESLGY